MDQLPNALAKLAEYNQFIVFKLAPSNSREGKFDKFPIDPRTGRSPVKGTGGAHDPSIWTDAQTAFVSAQQLGSNYGVGFVLTANDPFWFLDIDDCLLPNGSDWSPIAHELMHFFGGAAIEISSSGKGLHIFGCGTAPSHSCKNKALGLEFYTSERFVALTGMAAQGNIWIDWSSHLPNFVSRYFPPSTNVTALPSEWTTDAVAEWDGTESDDELLNKALRSASAGAVFGKRASFRDLWEKNEEALHKAYPDSYGNRTFDASSADAALAQHLAFWTGNNCERIQRLMQRSQLIREKWDREDYLRRTIIRACSLQRSWAVVDNRKIPEPELPTRPLPLPSLPEVPEFDLSLLPERLRPYVQDVAERQGCPVDFVAIAAMVALSGAVGRRRRIAAKLNDDWIVVPNLWGMCIGRPSSMKSPALDAATAPLKEIDSANALAFKQALDAFEIDDRLHKLRTKEAEASASKKAKFDKDAARTELIDFSKCAPIEPKRNRLIVNDASVEKLQEIMADNELGLVLIRDELAGWLQKLDGEDFAEARSFILTAFTGRQPFTVDRIGRGTIHIPASCLAIIGGIQPAKVSRLIKSAVNGTSDDGLLQRFQLVTWPDDAEKWQWRDRPPHQIAKAAYSRAFHDLHELAYMETALRQSTGAQELFRNWYTALQVETRSNLLHPAIESHLLKMPEAILSLALLIELADCPSAVEVGSLSMERAISWSDYLRAHGRRLYHTANSPEVEAARVILNKRKELSADAGVTAREIGRKGWTGIDSAQVAGDALELLVDLHHMYVMTTATAGRPTQRFFWKTEE
jgi:hypothetical protein